MAVKKLDSKIVKGLVAREGVPRNCLVSNWWYRGDGTGPEHGRGPVQDFGLQSQFDVRIIERPDRCLEGG